MSRIRVRTRRVLWWLRASMPWHEDPTSIRVPAARPLEDVLWNLESGPSNWRNPD